MSKPVNVKLTPQQIDFLRGVVYEYFHNTDYAYIDQETLDLREQLEVILAAAENKAYA